MRETTRERYEQLRRQRRRMRWNTIYQQRFVLGGTLLAAGVMLLALIFRAIPSRSALPQASPAPIQRQEGSPLRATAVPLESPVPVDSTPAPVPVEQHQALLFDGWRFTYEPGLTVEALQAILDSYPGQLKSYELWVGDRNYTVAEVLVGSAALYGINPKILLAFMELQQQLLSDPDPSEEQLVWAMNYRGDEGNMRGLGPQIRWALRELRRGIRDFPTATGLVFADDSRMPLPSGLDAPSYAILRTLARTVTPERLAQLAGDGPGSFLAVYSSLFEDPRQPLEALPPLAEPFLTYPLDRLAHITSFFDHEYPFLTQNGSLVSYWNRREAKISYDGHDGWDYGARPPTAVLAAAPGVVLFAGSSDDGCGSPARGVIIDHGNGYRTLYWHLSYVDVEIGQQIERGQVLGVVGATGCATGPHLHFQVHYLGRSTDPYGWCGDPRDDPWANHPVGAASSWLWLDRPNPCALPQNVLLVSAGGAGFVTTGSWDPAPIGIYGGSFWTRSLAPITATADLSGTAALSSTPVLSSTVTPLSGVAVQQTPQPDAPKELEATATWYPRLPAPGRYRVLAYVPYFFNGLEDARSVRYLIRHAGGRTEVTIDQRAIANDWADLGTYEFDPQQQPFVKLTNRTDAADEGVWASAMLWIPVEP
ncbi:MAG: peptidase M23 [Herpetosiphonaceae bacterium]|nr:MAG: peptidase M23 [Herpetosiphonaceae bacterium]